MFAKPRYGFSRFVLSAFPPGTVLIDVTRGVLVLRQIRSTEVDRVQVDRRAALQRAHAGEPVVADVDEVDGHRVRQHALHARLPLPLRRNLGVVLERH